MGLSASSYNYLRLNQQNASIKCKLLTLTTRKSMLDRDMDAAALEYQEAVSAKKLRMQNGANYVNMSYSNLMYPCAANNNDPYVITDMNGRVVVDEKYKDLAKMISPDGSPADWSSCRSNVLSQITGISATDIDDFERYHQTLLEDVSNYNAILASEPSRSSFVVESSQGTQLLLAKLGSFGDISNWGTAYADSTQTIAKSDMTSAVNHIKNSLSKYFMEDSELFKQACDAIADAGCPDDTIAVGDLIDMIIGSYSALGGAFCSSDYADPVTGNVHPLWYDVDSAAYAQYNNSYSTWKARLSAAEAKMNQSLDNYNTIFSAEDRTLLDFYDRVLSMIADKGWTYCPEITDDAYLNDSLINGSMFLTKVDRERVQDGYSTYYYENTYDTNVATNFRNVYMVNDNDKIDQALVEYEAKKRRINDKEKTIDIQIQKLTDESEAIKNMLESINKTMSDNIKENFTFKISG